MLEVRRATLSDRLAGRAALTAEMAIRIAQAFGPPADDLLEIQKNHAPAQARSRGRATGVQRYRAG